MRMHNPPHPGEIIRKLCLEPLDLSVTEMAVRLSIAFGTSSESWMNQQTQYGPVACREAAQGSAGLPRGCLT